MCGIFAYIVTGLKNGLSYDQIKDEYMKIQHRGPNESVLAPIDDNIFFGFHRLAINGLNFESSQPMEIDGCTLICNGEIYNYKKLAEKYDITLITNSDCEIILHLYLRFGIYMIKMLDAEFAFVLHDSKNDVTYMGRDHLGIRPLFLGKEGDNWMFASEAKPLLTHCRNIRQFKPGCYMSSKNFEEIQYYDYNAMECFNTYSSSALYKSDDIKTVYKNVKRILTKSVLDRTLSERPIGAFLSGGLDSSIVVSILSRVRKDIPVFTIGLEGSPDIKAAKEVSSYLGLKDHHIVNYTVEEGISAIPHVIKSLESYDITTIRASTPQWLLSKYIKDETDVVVLLSGECIDEICGYYFLAFSENDEDFEKNTNEMLKELYFFDLLRTDRTTSAHGLEVRVPFASKEFLQYVMNINTKFKRFKKNELEKKIIRNAFPGYLPDSVLYRKKHAFSDSVSSDTVSWYKEVAKHAEKVVDKKRWENRERLYPHNTPVCKESFWYRELFEKEFPGEEKLIPHYWMPKIKGRIITDPSATILEGFTE